VVENSVEESGPVFDGARHIPALDEVVGLRVGPGLLDIVDEEADVWGDPVDSPLAVCDKSLDLNDLPAGLDRAEIVSNDLLQSVEGSEVVGHNYFSRGIIIRFQKLAHVTISRWRKKETHLNSPNTRPTPNIKNAHSFWIDRG
jgi:hypothetical protein